MTAAWSVMMRLGELSQGPRTVILEPDAEQRAQIARQIDVISLPALRAELEVRPWLDGAEILGRFQAQVEQTCGVTLEDFEQPLSGAFEVQVVPAGSPHAPDEDSEMELDLEAPDPPDVLAGDVIDLAAYVIEHLALEVDPFPRKPGVSFEFDAGPEDDSPFAVLKRLQDPKG
ncbi:MAG: DUF177 domain-containing protein [Phenylobacterium sp.]|uniref:YceD family protein n=1 Tax=Phenylobacterium sp. TaxID=1871053 RepID=UPI002737226A|nr:DUF177 domain-containing protein [Phenylobacterium sp.]MDP3174853.1 DUF177 domain-containing protein [Phenylobacterium sp.]